MNFVFEAYLNMHVLWQTAKAESLSKIEFKNLLHFLGPIIRPIHKKKCQCDAYRVSDILPFLTISLVVYY